MYLPTDENESSGYLDVRDNLQKSHQFSDDMVNQIFQIHPARYVGPINMENKMCAYKIFVFKVGMQRRGHGEALGVNKNRVYWRCYFNAVTCF